MQRYDTYKDSGVKWLGEIPSHWEVNKAKYYLYSKKTIVGKDSANHERLALTLNGVIKRQDGDDIGLNPEKLDTYQIVESGNLIFKLIDLENFKTSRVGLTPYNGIVSPAYIRLINKGNVNMRFLEYYYLNMWHRKVFNDLGAPGVRSNLSANDLLNLCIVLPNVNEQDAIVSYLDTATAKIDAAIAQQQKMIDLLNERKQIIINRAVTKGLNPNAKMKDSGVEWIGEVPEEWCFVRLKHLTKIISKGTTPSTIGKEILPNGNIRFLKAENIVNNSVCENPEFFIDEATHAILKRSNLQENDLLFVIAGATIGKVAILPKELTPANTNQAISFIRLNNPEMAKYIWYVLQSEITKKYIWLNAVQSAQPNISMEDLGNIQMPIPDVSIQKETINSIEAKVSPIENSICNCQKQISLLQERKQIIINEVVTGKVKVV
ncbi:MAG: restriction endonuclease subunit S [Bacteroidales bacterium]|nr:restriction endonuclease subunit S [Bacteroidales bacterium]